MIKEAGIGLLFCKVIWNYLVVLTLVSPISTIGSTRFMIGPLKSA
jgi:multisubunit Na+/H+ antiporter MnhF subunit